MPPGHDPSTRDRLVAATYELLIEEGAEAPTIQALARRAGLTNGAVYANFAGRHELLREVALACWSRLPHARLTRLATGGAAGDEEDAQEVGADELIALLAEHQCAPPGPEHRLLADVTSAAMRNPDTEHMLRACLERLGSVAASSIERGKADGTVDTRLSTDVLVAVITDLYMGAITSNSLHLRQPPEQDALAVLRKLIAPDLA